MNLRVIFNHGISQISAGTEIKEGRSVTDMDGNVGYNGVSNGLNVESSALGNVPVM
jgi:hypothetical protein